MTSAPATSPAATAATATTAGTPTGDSYPYGWRYVKHEGPDGGETFEMMPLTLEDVLHPQEGDQMPESAPHERRRTYLSYVLAARLAHDPGAVVLSDVLVAWDTPDVRPHSPDITVILGVRERKPWRTFDMATEGARPALVIELTSPSTAVLDRSAKFEQYEQIGVPQYVLIDAARGKRIVPPLLLGYRLGPNGYRVQAPDGRGRLWLEVARVWLGVVDGELVCHDEEDRPLGDYTAVTEALTSATVALEEERAARASLEARVRELEAELQRRRD